MKKNTTKFLFFSLLFFLMISASIFQAINQDYTSIIDFDLTVIHNSLQLISNEYPDFQDLTSYSHFLTYGIFYKLFSIFDGDLITNINALVEFKNPELVLKELYIISRIANTTIHFIMIIFFYKILNFFQIKNIYKVLILLFLIISETFIANIIILRSDIVAVCYFLISFFYLLNFSKTEKIYDLIFVSFFMVFSLLAKVQIIFLFMFMFIFFIFYTANERKELSIIKNKFNILRYIDKNSKYILIILTLSYFLFQIYLNNFVNSSGVGYFDFFCFGVYFTVILLIISIISKIKNISKEYFYNVFCYIFLFSILHISILKIMSIIGLIKINFNIIFSITNPFYFLKIYSPLDKELSFNLVFEMISLLFTNFNFNPIYSLLLLVTLSFSLYKIFSNNNNNSNKNYTYIILLSGIIFLLIALNNFRYNVSYNIYVLPFLFLSLAIFFKSIKRKVVFTSIISALIIFNFISNIQNYQIYINNPSKLEHVCSNKSTRDFYYHWARNFDEKFFKKICLNNDLLFK
jgi:hypothetical protein